MGEKASITDYLGQKTSVATRDEYAIGYANKRVFTSTYDQRRETITSNHHDPNY